MRRVLFTGLLLLCAAPTFSADYVQMSGKELYRRFCAACHGAEGRGDGPVAGSFKVEVPDLTRARLAHDARVGRGPELPRARQPGSGARDAHRHRPAGRLRLAIAEASTVSATEAVGRLAQRHRIAAADCSVREGAAGAVIPAEASRQRADLLVMGAVSRSLPTRPVIGSTAERVIDRVDCDVFVVKPAGFKSQVNAGRRKGAWITLSRTDASP